MAEQQVETEILSLTDQIVSAHAGNNDLAPGALPGMIRAVYDTLSNVDKAPVAPVERAQPAVPIRKSVFPDFIVCLEDGKRLKMLKRHLSASYNLTPEQYRQKWGLDSSYPMVAPNYAERRSELAKQIGLGTHRTSGR
jgi:predicted transcriptional regulator